MAKFKVTNEVDIEGKTYNPGDAIELEDSVAAPLVEKGDIEADTSGEE